MTALRLIHSVTCANPVSLLTACRSVAYFERAVDLATQALVDCEPHERLKRHCARARLFAAGEQLEHARNRRDRIVCEQQGVRWLWVAGRDAE